MTFGAVFRHTILQSATPDHLAVASKRCLSWWWRGGPRIGGLLAGGATKLVAEGWVLLIGGSLCIAGAWAAAKLQPGFTGYGARNPVP